MKVRTHNRLPLSFPPYACGSQGGEGREALAGQPVPLLPTPGPCGPGCRSPYTAAGFKLQSRILANAVWGEAAPRVLSSACLACLFRAATHGPGERERGGRGEGGETSSFAPLPPRREGRLPRPSVRLHSQEHVLFTISARVTVTRSPKPSSSVGPPAGGLSLGRSTSQSGPRPQPTGRVLWSRAMILLQVHLQQPCYDFCFL